MFQKSFLLIFIITIVFALSLNACEGDQGPIGLEGNVGSTGNSGNDGTDGQDGTKGDKGDPGLVWMGPWSSTINYAANDVIHDQGSAYVCISSNVSDQPPSASWELLASKGSDGNWNGGTVTNEVTFSNRTRFQSNTVFDLGNEEIRFVGNSSIHWEDTDGGNEQRLEIHSDRITFAPGLDVNNKSLELEGKLSPKINLESLESGVSNQVRIQASPTGDCRLWMGNNQFGLGSAVRLDADYGDGGGGHFVLSGPSGSFEVDTNSGVFPILRITNSRGEVTFEVNGETGDIYYSGRLVKR